MVLEVVALYDEHEEGIEFLVSVYDGNEVARVAVSHHLKEKRRRREGEGREESMSAPAIASALPPDPSLS